MPFDQYSDVDKKPLEKLANVMVIKPKTDVEQLPDRSFALIIIGRRKHRQFPICDPESTLLSLLYFLKNRTIMPSMCAKIAGARIKEACFRFGIDAEGGLDEYPLGLGGKSHKVTVEELQKEAAKLRAAERNKLPDSAFGLIIEKDGKKIRKFPMHDKVHTMKAIQFFSRAKGLTPEQRETLARNIARRAKEFGIETDIGRKVASVNPYIVRDMAFRVRHVEDEQVKTAYLKVAEMVQGQKITPEEAVAVIHTLDQKYGLNDYKYRLSPESLVEGTYVNALEKSASVKDFARWALAEEIEKTAAANPGERIQMILENPEQKKRLMTRLSEQFGEEVANGIVTDPATIFDSLPKPYQEIVEQILEQVESEG